MSSGYNTSYMEYICSVIHLLVGDVVTLLSSNSIEWVVSFLATLSVGAICSTANPLYTTG